MNTTNKITNKRSYFPPIVKRIMLDNEISLALQSNPPVGPDEVYRNTSVSFNYDPYQNIV